MKLEPKHIAPYFPYGLRVQYIDPITNKKRTANLTSVGIKEIETTYNRKIKGCSGDIISWSGHNSVEQMKVKPLLRPLSDLTKEIELNGEKFVPIEMLSYYANEQTEKGTTGLEWGIVSSLPYTDIEKILEWHFDVFSLIPNGIAIDINTLKS